MGSPGNHTNIPEKELEVFKKLKYLKVIFDVGAREDIDYAILCPKATCHLFEPNPLFFTGLVGKTKDLSNVVLNNFGLGEIEGEYEYHDGLESIAGSRAWSDPNAKGNQRVKIETLNNYILKNEIKRIDFLKMDTEGSELGILKSGMEAIKITKYLQYEHYNNISDFDSVLGEDFECHNIGYRNVFCVNKHLVAPRIGNELKNFIIKGNYKDLV